MAGEARTIEARWDPLHQKGKCVCRTPSSSARSGRWEWVAGGWDGVRAAVWSEELRRTGVPAVRLGMGESLVGPAIIVHGTPHQRKHFLPRIVVGTDVYCQA